MQDFQENEITDGPKKSKTGLTGWLKSKFLGKAKNISPVDEKFLEDLEDLEKIGRYEITGKLGQGSMGIVYKGRDPYIKRDVGIKVSRPSSDVEGKIADRYREKFFLEAQSAGILLHPNIVAIYDAGMHKDFCYIAMEYIDGYTLVKHCESDDLLPVADAVEIITKACMALDFAHQKGIIHRDIKPSNIMLTKSGEVKITDFGIARIKSNQTISKGVIGSPSYMSPEQIKEEPVEAISDVFSMGCVLYELLAGEKAFPGENHFSIMYKITNVEPVPLQDIRNDIPEILIQVISKALSKEPSQRYQTCMDFAYALRVILRGLRHEVVKNNKAEDVIDYIHNVQFFNDFTKEQVKDIMETANVVKVAKGSVMMMEGEIDDSFFIILSGKAIVRKNDQDIATIGRGECFGEMAYLSGGSRTATVLAETECILLKISAMLLDKSPESIQLLFLKRFAMTLLKRLSVSISKPA